MLFDGITSLQARLPIQSFLQELVDRSVQTVALVKFGIVVLCNSLPGLLQTGPKTNKGGATLSWQTRRLLIGLGLLDCTAYFLHTLGFGLCGASLATLVVAATGQLFTAILSWVLLHKFPNFFQCLAVGFAELAYASCCEAFGQCNIADTKIFPAEGSFQGIKGRSQIIPQ